MKAIIYKNYGSADVLRFEETKKPVPKDDEVLIKVYASSINKAEWYKMNGKPFFMRFMGVGLFKPKNKILGGDISGVVEAVGKNVKNFKTGDEVYGDVSWGGYAEYVCALENLIAHKPQNMSHEEAAALPIAALTALQGLRDKGEIKSGQKVLITGASGGVGNYAVQIAKSYGTEVTAVCRTESVEFVKSLGADRVIDFTKESYLQEIEYYDLVFDGASFHSLEDILKVLREGGNYVLVGGAIKQMLKVMMVGKRVAKKENKNIRHFIADSNTADLNFLRELIEAGKVKSFIDSSFSLSKLPKAMRHFENEHIRGKLVITTNDNEETLKKIAAEGKKLSSLFMLTNFIGV